MKNQIIGAVIAGVIVLVIKEVIFDRPQPQQPGMMV